LWRGGQSIDVLWIDVLAVVQDDEVLLAAKQANIALSPIALSIQ
jgi:hypothetical protein